MLTDSLFSHYPAYRCLFRVYDLAWNAAIPLLRLNSRLADGYAARTLAAPLPPADIWIQSASVGEAFLSLEIIRRLAPRRKTRILLTTNTRQGLDILSAGLPEDRSQNLHLPKETFTEIITACFPFDRPTLMEQVVRQVRPRLMVLLETELWPGLLAALKRAQVPVLLANGRLSKKSLHRYQYVPQLFRILAPDTILAISDADADRFQRLFGKAQVHRIENIKFDRLVPPQLPSASENPLQNLFPDDKRMILFGSVRKEEEADVLKIVQALHHRFPDHRIALFPRHVSRLASWMARLRSAGIPYCLRSRAGTRPNSTDIRLILWDTFGELTHAYALADAAFVGGTLAPLGGQNFLEPMMAGLIPVIGPHWKDFYWVGESVLDAGLVKMGKEWQAVLQLLTEQTEALKNRIEVQNRAMAYIRSRQGGTAQVCEAMMAMLKK